MLMADEGDHRGTNHYCGTVLSTNRGSIESSVVVEVAEGLTLCSILCTEELDELQLEQGARACAFFSPFSVVLGLPEE